MARMLAPIITIKHYVQAENAALADAARRAINLVDAVGQAAVSTTDHVVEGSLVKNIYIELWVKSNATAGTENKFQFVIEKVQAGFAAITFTQMNNLMAYENKRNIFYFTQGVVGDLTTASQPVFRGWLKIPRGKQRFALGDKLVMSLSATGATMNNCGFATYKEYK